MKNFNKIFFSVLLLLSFTWQCSAKTIIYFNFKANQQKLAETLCENKDKPNSCCVAKCVLDKEIKKEENRQADLPNSLKDKAEKSEILTSVFNLVCYNTSLIQIIYFPYQSFSLTKFQSFIFHPPQ